MSAPSVIVLGGPNGSGKSTAAVRLLRDELQVMEFVNADQIAQGLSAFRSDVHALKAGRVMLEHLNELAANRDDFAFETTLASRSFAPWLQNLRQNWGYQFRLVYIWLPHVELNIERVAVRVALGGHSIPEETIRRRYSRSLQNLFELYLPIADLWEIFDNTEPSGPRLAARGQLGMEPTILENQSWQTLKEQHVG